MPGLPGLLSSGIYHAARGRATGGGRLPLRRPRSSRRCQRRSVGYLAPPHTPSPRSSGRPFVDRTVTPARGAREVPAVARAASPSRSRAPRVPPGDTGGSSPGADRPRRRGTARPAPPADTSRRTNKADKQRVALDSKGGPGFHWIPSGPWDFNASQVFDKGWPWFVPTGSSLLGRPFSSAG